MRTASEATGTAHDGPGAFGVAATSSIIEAVSTSLSSLSVARRRHIAATLGLFAMLFLAVGAVAATGQSTTVVDVFVVIALIIALMLALLAWGVLHSITLDRAAVRSVDEGRRIDAAIEQALAEQGGGLTCGCGHDHDPDELHVTDDPCSRDGSGHECSHTCDTCVFSRLRAVPGSAALDGGAAEPSRPAPRPGVGRPMPSRAGSSD